MSIKPKIIRFLSPLRRLYSDIYSFVLAAYLGKTIIVLNQIDHDILDWIFYFFVFSPTKQGVKEFYKVVSSQTMGKKLGWLREIYKGNINVINRETKTSLQIVSTVNILVKNKTVNTMISLFDDLIKDTRNPLVHSNYFLGGGNEYEWKLSYHRFHFNRAKDDFDNSPFTLKEAREYLKTVQQSHKELMKLYLQVFNEAVPL